MPLERNKMSERKDEHIKKDYVNESKYMCEINVYEAEKILEQAIKKEE
jgi:hypothetical protein